jgi:ATP-dependent RNA helicase RhlE
VGDAFTLVTPENAADIRDIQRFIGAKIPELRLEGFNYRPIVARPVEEQAQRPKGSLPGQIRHKGSFNRFRGRR